jgi:ornithine cyclodeaminase/alanine dehydrogenase-like protein (mu-crystallin family)
MPALGGGYALLKWVSSFPGNPARGLATVNGAVLLSNAETGELEALLDAAAVTALRTGAAAVLAAEALAREDATTATVVGAGVNGRAVARTFLARGRAVALFDLDEERARRVAAELGVSVLRSRAEALDADILVTVTPGSVPVVGEGELKRGQHVSLMGADGPGKNEISPAELARARVSGDDRKQVGPNRSATRPDRVRLFCDDWEQASHSGDIAGAVELGRLERGDVTELGAVLTGVASGRQSPADITLFDSTGLAIQDLAVAIACFERRDEFDLPTIDL